VHTWSSKLSQKSMDHSIVIHKPQNGIVSI
jgi:hypothetical protein